jgi:hypothetical protein
LMVIFHCRSVMRVKVHGMAFWVAQTNIDWGY